MASYWVVADGDAEGGEQLLYFVRADGFGRLDCGQFGLGGGFGALGFGDPASDDGGVGACLERAVAVDSWRAGEEGAEWIEIHSGIGGVYTDRPES